MHVIEKILLVLGIMALVSNAIAAGGPGGGGPSGGQGKGNSNAQSLPDSDRGLDRANERKSDEGLEHGKATAKKKTANAKAKNPPQADLPKPPEPPKPRVP